jgi:hypothetical protein
VTAERGGGPLPADFEVFGTALGCSLVAGALSLVAPFLAALTVTLVALSVAGWCSLLRRRGLRVDALLRSDRLVALALLGAAAVLYTIPPPALATVRALTLALAGVPIWLVERYRPVGPPLPGGEP